MRETLGTILAERGLVIAGGDRDKVTCAQGLAAMQIAAYPIIRCGDSKVVLAVDREELVVAGCAESAKCARCTFDAPDCPWARASVDAILGKLDLRKADLVRLRKLQAELEVTEPFDGEETNACLEIVAWARELFKPSQANKLNVDYVECPSCGGKHSGTCHQCKGAGRVPRLQGSVLKPSPTSKEREV